MISAENYLKSLTKKSIWAFTKQKVDFDQAIKVANLFDSIPNREDTNIEIYFEKHHNEFWIETDRHRTLVIPQFFWLITKTPFYEKWWRYNKEKTTAVYDKFKTINYETNVREFNTLKTEQLLKIKIHAIIDTANNNEWYNILPIIFIYKVLKELQIQYNITKIPIEYLYLYIMTRKTYNEWVDAVEMISKNPPIDNKLVEEMDDFSRVLTLIRQNIKLFLFEDKKISINPIFDQYFYKKLILKFDLDELSEILDRDVDYSYFLYNIQDFDVNLIDEPIDINAKLEELELSWNKEIIPIENSDEENDSNYITKIEEIQESNVNPEVWKTAFKEAPVFWEWIAISKKYKRNPLLWKIAIQKAYYSCEADPEHLTFESAVTHKNFMEAHHLVPVKDQWKIRNKYHINVDCVENIVSLCPTCHRAFHNWTDYVKKKMIKTLYHHLLPRYRNIWFDITEEEIEKLYWLK